MSHSGSNASSVSTSTAFSMSYARASVISRFSFMEGHVDTRHLHLALHPVDEHTEVTPDVDQGSALVDQLERGLFDVALVVGVEGFEPLDGDVADGRRLVAGEAELPASSV